MAEIQEKICRSVEKLNSYSGKWIVDSGKWKKIFSSSILHYPPSTIHFPLFVSCFILLSSCLSLAYGQQPARDSLHVVRQSMDSLLKLDSIELAFEAADEQRFARTRQLATQRSMQMTDDTMPEILRLSGIVPKDNVGKTKLTFTIKLGKRTLFEDSWLAEGYFDSKDNLPDSVKLRRLRTIVTVFFANENFEVVDSNEFAEMMNRVTKAEIEPNSDDSRELFQKPRVMYSVFHSRDYWYGLIWDPPKGKFLKAWRN